MEYIKCPICIYVDFPQFQDETNTAMYHFVSSKPSSVKNWAQAIAFRNSPVYFGLVITRAI